MIKLLGADFTSDWLQIVALLTSNRQKYDQFLIRYAYHIWRERNQRRHGEPALTTATLIKLIDNFEHKDAFIVKKV